MQEKQITIKTTPKVKRLLRLAAAYTDEKQYQVLERLLELEVDKVRPHAVKD